MTYEEILRLPKIELHCHLDGSLSVPFVQKVLGAEVSAQMLQVGMECESLTEYLSKFDLPLQCLISRKNLSDAAFELLRTVSRENVRYIEVRFAPMLSVSEGLSAEQVIAAVLEGLRKGREKYQVDFNVIVCAMRHHNSRENIKMLKAAAHFLGKGVCGADLAGDENKYPMNEFGYLMREAQDLGFPMTVHAGETGNVQNIWDAVNMGAKRIGHGIAMSGREDLKKVCVQKGIGFELCPISNMQTKAATKENYPIREFLERGLKVTVNTDNRLVSHTSLTEEIDFLQKNYGLEEREICSLMRNAVEVSFADDKLKEKLYGMYE